MDSTRQLKISRLLQKELGKIFLNYARSMHGVLLTVTEVRISPDLSIAHCYLSIFPTERANEIMTQIEDDTSKIRFQLGNIVHNQLRIIPELNFHIDPTLDKLDHIDELLKK
ncbi:MAG: ribosome-binding factor A [Paludibacteraceae bacterium]|jgi:ribosome-binding factor A|nr:ribosome-binding factor A [Paludibacteraceae bacterium]